MSQPYQLRLHYPFPKPDCVNCEWAEAMVLQWIDKEYATVPERVKNRIRKCNFGYLAAHYFPYANRQQLLFITRWVLWVTFHDEFYGACYAPDALKRVCDRSIELFRGGRLTSEERSNEYAMLAHIEQVREQLLPYVTQEWLNRFIHSNQQYMDAIVTDAALHSYREQVNYPTIQEYIRIREKIVAVFPCLDLLEIVAGFLLPETVFALPAIQRIRGIASLLTGFCNDLFSVEKERKEHEAMNLVLVVQQEKGCSLDEAYAEALRIHDAYLEEYLQLQSSLPDLGVYNKPLNNYLFHVNQLVQGNLLWHLKTRRYILFGGAESQESAVS